MGSICQPIEGWGRVGIMILLPKLLRFATLHFRHVDGRAEQGKTKQIDPFNYS